MTTAATATPPITGPVAEPEPAPAPVVVRAPRIVRWLDVPDYEGFRCRAWINIPRRVLDELGAGDQERTLAALRSVVLEHNHWGDDEGNAYPAADAADFWDVLLRDGTQGAHLVSCIIRGIRDAAVSSGNSPRPNGRP